MGVYSIPVLPRASEWQTEWRLPPPRGGGGAAHIPERGEGGPFSPQGEPCPEPSTQNHVPCREQQTLDAGYLPPCPSTSLLCLLQAPFLRIPEPPAIIQKTDRSTYCVLKS